MSGDKREQLKEIIKFFSYDSAARWASQTIQFQGQDLKDETVKAQYLQAHLEEKQRQLNRLQEMAESGLLHDPGILKEISGKALSSEVVAVLAQAAARLKSGQLLPILLKNFKRADTRARCAVLRAVASAGGAAEYSFLNSALLEEKEEVVRAEVARALEAVFHQEPLLGMLAGAKSGQGELCPIDPKKCPEMAQWLVQYFTMDEQVKILGYIKARAPEAYGEIIKEINLRYKRDQKEKMKAARPSELALLLAGVAEGAEPPRDIMREAARLFWGLGREARERLLQSLAPAAAARFLRAGLMGTAQQAAAALEYIKQERRYLEPLMAEVISLGAGDSLELAGLAGELLLLEKPECFSGQRWLILRLASLAAGEEPLEKRLPLISALAGLTEKQQAFHLEHCRDRDDLLKVLLINRKFPEILSLLRFSLQRWQPEVESTADLVWLTRVLGELKESSRGFKAELSLKALGGALFQANSSSYLDLLLEEAQAAAAAAWHRCLRGPGGVNIYLANLWVFDDSDLAGEILGLLADDPVAYTALAKEAPEHSGRSGLAEALALEYLSKGALNAEICLTSLLGEALVSAAGDAQKLKEIIAILTPAQKRLQPFLQALGEEYCQQIKNLSYDLQSLKERISGQVLAGADSIALQIKGAAAAPGTTPKARILEVYASELQYAVKEAIGGFEWQPGFDHSAHQGAKSLEALVQQAASLLMEINRLKALAGTLEARFLNYLGQRISLIIEKIQLWLYKNKALPALDEALAGWLERQGLMLIARPGEVTEFDPVLHTEQGEVSAGAKVAARSTGLKGPDGTVLRKAVVEYYCREEEAK